MTIFQTSNEKQLGCLGYIGGYTTELYGDNSNHKDPVVKQPG